MNHIIWEISSAQIFHETPHIILHFISLVIASENLEYINSLEMIGERERKRQNGCVRTINEKNL